MHWSFSESSVIFIEPKKNFMHGLFFNWKLIHVVLLKLDESQTTYQKQQSFMAFILCKIFVEEPFSIIKMWEKYWIID